MQPRAGWTVIINFDCDFAIDHDFLENIDIDQLTDSVTFEVKSSDIETDLKANDPYFAESVLPKFYLYFDLTLSMSFLAKDLDDFKKQVWDRFNKLQFDFKNLPEGVQVEMNYVDDFTFYDIYSDLFDQNYDIESFNSLPKYLDISPCAFYDENEFNGGNFPSFHQEMNGRKVKWKMTKNNKLKLVN